MYKNHKRGATLIHKVLTSEIKSKQQMASPCHNLTMNTKRKHLHHCQV